MLAAQLRQRQTSLMLLQSKRPASPAAVMIDAKRSGGSARLGFFAAEFDTIPRQEFRDAIDRVCGDPLENVAQIGLGVDAVEACGPDQRRDRRGTSVTGIRSGEQPVLPPRAIGRIARSTGLLSISTVPSSA